MDKNAVFWVTLGIVLIPTGLRASAAPLTMVQSTPRASQSPWTVFGGFGGGFGGASSPEYNSAPAGAQLLVSADLSHESPDWVLDAGLGWIYSNSSGTLRDNREVRLRTRSGRLEFSPRFRVGDRWQVGPAVSALFGSDSTFAPSIGNQTTTWYAGIKTAYAIPSASLPIRLWAEALTDISIPGREARAILGGIQIGLPLRRQEAPEKSVMAESDAQELSSHSRNVRLVLDPQRVFFGTNSSNVRGEIAEVLKDVGDYLNTHPDQWENATISGHADQRGRREYNLRLSERRARSVHSALTQGGAPHERLSVEAFSFDRPLDPSNNPKAWARNRRVELEFRNVRDPAALVAKLRPLMVLAPGQMDVIEPPGVKK